MATSHCSLDVLWLLFLPFLGIIIGWWVLHHGNAMPWVGWESCGQEQAWCQDLIRQMDRGNVLL
jgi:hypothetical protein